MGFIILIILLIVTPIAALQRPYIGAFAYAIMSIMAPQYIWFWVFEGVPAFTIIAGSTLLTFGVALLMGKLDISVYKHKQSALLIIFWALFNLSDKLSPFQGFFANTSAELVLRNFNIMILMYFVALPLISKKEHLGLFCILFICVTTYYVYWSNEAYFNFDPSRFGYQNRLYGPELSPYYDQNVFATLFVMGIPFLLFGFFYYKSLYVKGALAVIGLLALHSIILTGSRGALVGLSVVVLFSYFLIKSRSFGFILVIGFVAGIAYQGGALRDRSSDTIDTAKENQEKSIDPRVASWIVGIELIKMYPILGVGVQRFQHATKLHFPQNRPYVAHNTFLNFAANSGLINGLIFLYLYYLTFRNFRFAIKNKISDYPDLDFYNKVFMTSLTGFYVCSLFLDLIIFEAFYFLLLLNFLKDFFFRQHLGKKVESSDDTKVKASYRTYGRPPHV